MATVQQFRLGQAVLALLCAMAAEASLFMSVFPPGYALLVAASGNLQCLLKLGLSPAHRNCLPQEAGQCGYTPSLSGGGGMGAGTAIP